MWKGTSIDYTIKPDFRINKEEIQDLDVKKNKLWQSHKWVKYFLNNVTMTLYCVLKQQLFHCSYIPYYYSFNTSANLDLLNRTYLVWNQKSHLASLYSSLVFSITAEYVSSKFRFVSLWNWDRKKLLAFSLYVFWRGWLKVAAISSTICKMASYQKGFD